MATNQAYKDSTVYTGTPSPRTVYNYDADNFIFPSDRVRWAAVLAGLFTVIASMVVFAILGVALGLSSFDANQPNNFVAGAGIYGAITSLLSFALGGFIAARTAGVAGRGNGVLHGGMVWIVTTALMVVILGNGIGTLLNVAGDAATATASVAGPVAAEVSGNVAQNPALQATAATGATQVAPTAENAIQDAQQQLQSVTPEQINETVRDLSPAAWIALLIAGLTAAAAIIGGVLGSRRYMTQELTGNTPASAS